MSEVELSLIASTQGLYLPPVGLAFVFMLAEPVSAPAKIALEATWAVRGEPAEVGWHVFVSEPPSPADAATLEKYLRGALAGDRGLAWATAPPAVPGVIGQAPIGLDSADAPQIGAESPFALPVGVPQLTIAAGLAVAALGPGPAALGIASPGVPAALGFTIELTGVASGCIVFRALLASPVDGEASVKPLAAVQFDPLDPWDPQRTRIVPLGPQYAFIHNAGGYRLETADA